MDFARFGVRTGHPDGRRPLPHRRDPQGQRRLPRRAAGRRDPHPRTRPGAGSVRHRRQPAHHHGRRRSAPRGLRAPRAAGDGGHLPQRDRLAGPLHAARHRPAPAGRPAVHLPPHAGPAVPPVPPGHAGGRRAPRASSATRPRSTSGWPRPAGSACSAPRPAQRVLEAATRRHTRRLRRRPPRRPARRCPRRRLLDLLLRLTRQPSFSKLLGHPHGLRRGDHAAGSFLGGAGRDRRRQGAPRPRAPDRAGRHPRGRLRPGPGRRRPDSCSSPSATPRPTTPGPTTTRTWSRARVATPTTCTSTPSDAERLGLEDGDLADVSTEVATVRLPVKLLDDLMPGTVALPHGWGHQHATGPVGRVRGHPRGQREPPGRERARATSTRPRACRT